MFLDIETEERMVVLPTRHALATAMLDRFAASSTGLDRNCLVRALGEIGDPAAVPYLLRVLSENTDSAAAYAIGEIGDQSLVPVLLNELSRPTRAIHGIIWSLGTLGGDKAVAALASLATCFDEGIRGEAVSALAVAGGPLAINAIMDALADPDDGVRWAAMCAIGDAGDASIVPALCRMMRGTCPEAVVSAIGALGHLRDQGAVPALVDWLHEAAHPYRSAAIRALVSIGGPHAALGLSEVMSDPEIACDAATGLIDMDESVPISALKSALTSGAPELKLLAARLLAAVRSEEATDLLRVSLQDTRSTVRRAAALALGEAGDRTAVHGLLEMLAKRPRSGRADVLHALGSIGSDDVVAALALHLTDRDPEIRCAAAEAIGRAGGELGCRLLRAALRERLTICVVDALGEIGDGAAANALAEVLLDALDLGARGELFPEPVGAAASQPLRCWTELSEEEQFRVEAARTLGRIGGPEASRALAVASEDRVGLVRMAALEAMGEIGDRAAAGAVAARLWDATEDVRWRARLALTRLRGPAAARALEECFCFPDACRADEVARALREAGDEAALRALVRGLDSTSPAVAIACAHELAVHLDAQRR